MPHQRARRSRNATTECDPHDTNAHAGKGVRFLFVGERPSHRAAQIGATWQNGKLAAKTLREALLALNLDPAEHHYLNLYQHPERSADDASHEQSVCRAIQEYVQQGCTIVALGRIVSRRLRAHRIHHRRLIHPAARGAIRKRERYQAHVAAVLPGARKESSR